MSRYTPVMDDMPAARPSGRDLLVRQEASENFELARHGGSWMVVTGFVVAVFWIVGAISMAVGLWGVDELKLMPPLVLAGGGMALVVPALLMIMAGYMGRTNRRAAASNALVMEAAVRLMAPAREAGTEGITFAEQMKQAAAEVDRAMAHALSAMKAMAGEIGDERLRLESVAYASADNARELTERLGQERHALEGLARDLRTHMQSLNEAIPRQAQMMVKAARDASEEVSRADGALEQRLESMQLAGRTLSEKLVELDALARDAATRTETLTFAVSRVEEKLDQSRRTVDAAVRAGEIAAAAAMTTGDALKDAVSSALDGARRANHEINNSTREAAENAARALARLREAGDEAAAAIRSAEYAAKADTVRMEHKLRQATVEEDASRGEIEPEQGPPAIVPPQAEPEFGADTEFEPEPFDAESFDDEFEEDDTFEPAPVRNGNGHANGYHPIVRNGHVPEPAPEQADDEPVERPAAPEPAPAARPSMEDELFDAAADALADASLSDEPDVPEDTWDFGRELEKRQPEPAPHLLRRRHDDVPLDAPTPDKTPRRRATDFLPAAPELPEPTVEPEPAPMVPAQPSSPPASGAEMGWRDIISDMSREDRPVRQREEVAEELIDRLQTSGIILPEAIRPKAKRKIAEAARRGVKERKSAIISQAGRQVERVTQRLRNDRELMDLARDFLDMESEDALHALEQTQKTGRNASARLAAYLLLDAAL
ncbi:hypothetical protein [Hyphomonas atlantica]|uniref:hypothetical protein n=1 Tax=Hyphomonas atlantica TaxID=1280948 RepID=UPI0023F03C70|nr:hypothetical protein [Hyphomonas atlantica]